MARKDLPWLETSRLTKESSVLYILCVCLTLVLNEANSKPDYRDAELNITSVDALLNHGLLPPTPLLFL